MGGKGYRQAVFPQLKSIICHQARILIIFPHEILAKNQRNSEGNLSKYLANIFAFMGFPVINLHRPTPLLLEI